MYFLVLRQTADEVANLERELRELQITAERLVQRREQTEKYLEDTEHRLKTRKDGTCYKTDKHCINLFSLRSWQFFSVCFSSARKLNLGRNRKRCGRG